jgi:uncharacterized membrane protein
MHLTPQEGDAVEARIAHVETRTGVQVVTAVVGRCDGYPEIVWKAFALGIAAAALVVVALEVMHPDWAREHAAWFNVVPILAAVR